MGNKGCWKSRTFKISRKEKLKKLMDNYCNKQRLNRANVEFFYEEENRWTSIKDDQTADEIMISAKRKNSFIGIEIRAYVKDDVENNHMDNNGEVEHRIVEEDEEDEEYEGVRMVYANA